jgi:hypothetical protein
LTSVCIPLSGKIFSWKKISAAGRWRGFDFFSSKKIGRGEEISMSGLERLDRLSLPRRTRRRAWNGNYRHGARTKATIELWRFIKSLS